VESRDPLDRYNSQLLGYYNQLVTAVSNNAKYNQIGVDGFEDYYYNNILDPEYRKCEKKEHFGFENALENIVKDRTTAHSGEYYLNLEPLQTIERTYLLDRSCDSNTGYRSNTQENQNPIFKIDSCDCIGTFNPEPGDYVLSGWVYQGLNPPNGEVADASIILYANGNSIGSFKGEALPIEGWQRIYTVFNIPPGSYNLKLELENISSTEDVSFDDIRIHPFDASFKSYVYDDVTLRFTYELDENNYFTAYEYDNAGNLERIKKETERGIMMIQESRFGQQKRMGQ